MTRSPFLDVWQEYLGLLSCPDCVDMDAGLEYRAEGAGEYLVCSICGRRFNIIKGIPILLPLNSPYDVGAPQGQGSTADASMSARGTGELEDWKYLSYQYYSRHREFMKSLDLFDPDGIVLDVGCAGGSLAKHFKRYIGLDLSWKLISFARSYLKRPFLIADAARIPFKTKTMTHFISRNMLEHTMEDRVIIREISRVCSGNGVFELPCSDGISILFDPINVIRAKRGKTPRHIFSYGFGHINMQTGGEWENRLRANGFIITGESKLGRGIIYKLTTLVEFILFSFGDNDDIPVKQVKKKYFRYVHPIYDMLYTLDPKTSRSWSRVFKVQPNGSRDDTK